MARVRAITPDDAEALTSLYRDYEWWDDRTVADVRAALAETEVAVGVVDDGDDGSAALVAAARVLTDYTYYATVYDVIVAADRRGEGLGRRLMEGVRDRLAFETLPGLSLLCREGLVPFYESVGFERYDRELEVPEGGTEELVRMTWRPDDPE